jgi:hypothetical protein
MSNLYEITSILAVFYDRQTGEPEKYQELLLSRDGKRMVLSPMEECVSMSSVPGRPTRHRIKINQLVRREVSNLYHVMQDIFAGDAKAVENILKIRHPIRFCIYDHTGLNIGQTNTVGEYIYGDRDGPAVGMTFVFRKVDFLASPV